MEESDILQGLIQQGPTGAAAAIAQKLVLEINVTSDNDMFDAKVRQISDGAVTDGLNAMADEMEEGQQ